MQMYGLPEVTLPEVPAPLIDEARRLEILDEIKASQSKTLILLGDQPIKWFLRYYDDRWKKLSDFPDYGKICEAEIDGRLYRILPLVHPRQAAKLGAYSGKWADLHQKWIKK